MSRRRTMAVRCPECGAYLDHNERCDCERINAERREAKRLSNGRKLADANRRMYELALHEFDCN